MTDRITAYLVKLQALEKAIRDYRREAEAIGNPMMPWPALEIALDQLEDAKCS